MAWTGAAAQEVATPWERFQRQAAACASGDPAAWQALDALQLELLDEIAPALIEPRALARALAESDPRTAASGTGWAVWWPRLERLAAHFASDALSAADDPGGDPSQHLDRFRTTLQRLSDLCYALDSAARLALEERRPLPRERLLDVAAAAAFSDERRAVDLLYLQARLHYERGEAAAALALARGIADAGRPEVGLLTAETLRQLDDHEQALDVLAGLEADLAEGDTLWASLLASRAQVFADAGTPERATEDVLALVARARELPVSGVFERERLTALLAAVRNARARGDHELAVETLAGFLQDPGFCADAPQLRAQLLVLQGRSERLLGRDAATSTLAAALALDPDPREAMAAHVALARAHLGGGRFDRAAEQLVQARALHERAPDVVWEADTQAELSAAEVRLALARADDATSLRAALDRLGEALGEVVAALERLPLSPAGSGLLRYDRRGYALGAWVRGTTALSGGRDDPAVVAEIVEPLLALHGVATLARRAAAPAPSWAQVTGALLAPGRGLLLYLPGDGGGHVLAVDGRGVVTGATADQDDVRRLRAGYAERLDAGLPEDAALRDAALARERELAGQLARALLPAAVAERLSGWDAVVIVDSDLHGSVPYRWLPLGDERHLGHRRAVSHVPNLALAVQRASVPVAASADAHDLTLCVGTLPHATVASRWPGLATLPWESRWEQWLVAPYGAERVRVLSAGSAVPDALSRPGGAVLQLLVHGVHDERRLRPAQLVLSGDEQQDGLLDCARIETLQAPPLVIASACRSGRGPVRRGDAAVGDVSGAWLLAGARAVIVAEGDLAYRSTLQLSRELHVELAAGAATARALTDAIARLESGAADDGPFRYGLLRVVGAGHERPLAPGAPAGERDPASAPSTPRPSAGRPWSWAALVALLAALVWRRRRR